MNINLLNIKLLLLLAIVSFPATAQILISTEVQTNGDILVKWKDNEAATAKGYILKWSYDANNLTNDTPLDNTTTSHTITGVDANTQRVFLSLIRQERAKDDEFFSSTIFTVATTLANGAISQIVFNTIYKKPIGNYYLERLENSQWKKIAQFPSVSIDELISYWDTISYPFCEPSKIEYRVHFIFDSQDDIYSISNVCSVNSSSDQTNPKNAIDDFVSVTGTGMHENATIAWNLPNINDIDSIIIQRKDPNGTNFLDIATVYKTETSFNDKVADVCNNIYEYALICKDRCGLKSYGTYPYQRKNIVLNIEEDLSQNNITLSWNKYNDTPNQVEYYNIYKTASGGTSEIIEVEPNVFTYSDGKLTSGIEYTYYVEAVLNNKNITSRSCKKNIVFNGISSVQNCYINAATVINDNSVSVLVTYSPENTADKVILERATAINGSFVEVNSISTNNGYIPANFKIFDNKVDVNYNSYFYRIKISNKFMSQPDISENIGVNILLKCQTNNTENILSWNTYQHWNEGVREYKVIRIIDTQVDTISTQISTLLTDNINANTNVCYRVLAISNPDLNGNKNISLSNTTCAIRESQFAVPNAFRPQGYNSEFKPKIFAFDSNKYVMYIYDKWGKLLFETNSYSKGWDGQHNGKAATPDVYTYVIKYSDLYNKSILKTGTFLLLR